MSTEEWLGSLVIRELKEELDKRHVGNRNRNSFPKWLFSLPSHRFQSAYCGLKTTGKSKQILLNRLTEYVAKHGREIVTSTGAAQAISRQQLRPRPVVQTPVQAYPATPRSERATKVDYRSRGKRKKPESSDSPSADSFDTAELGGEYGASGDPFAFSSSIFPTSGGLSDSPGAFGGTSKSRSARRKSASKAGWSRVADDADEMDDDDDDGDLDLQGPPPTAAGGEEIVSSDLHDSSMSEAGSPPHHHSDVEGSRTGAGGLFDQFEPIRSEQSEESKAATGIGAVTPQMESAEPVASSKIPNVPASSTPSIVVDVSSPHQIKSPIADFSSPPSASPALMTQDISHEKQLQQIQQLQQHQEALGGGAQYMFESGPSGGAGLSSPSGSISSTGSGSISVPSGYGLDAPATSQSQMLLHPHAQHQHALHPSLTHQQSYVQPPGAPMIPRRNPAQGMPPAVHARKPVHSRSQSTSAVTSVANNRVYLVPTNSFPSSVAPKDGQGVGTSASDMIAQSHPHSYHSGVGGLHQPMASSSGRPAQAPQVQPQNPFSFLQAFASVTVQNLPLDSAISAVRHGETYLGAIRDRLTQFAERRSALHQQQQQRLLHQHQQQQRRASAQMYGGTPLIPHDAGPAPPLVKRLKPNELILDLPLETPYLPPRSDSMVIHIAYSSVFPRGSRELKIGNLNRSMPGPMDTVRVLEHDDASSALLSISDGDVLILLEGVHRLSHTIENKRLEIIGIAQHGSVSIVSDDMRPQSVMLSSAPKSTVHVGSNSAVRLFNVSIFGSTKEVSEAIFVSEQSLAHLENVSVQSGNVGLLIQPHSSAVIHNSTFSDTRSSAIRIMSSSENLVVENSTLTNCCLGIPIMPPLIRIPSTLRRGAAAAIEIMASSLSEELSDQDVLSNILVTVRLSGCKIVENWGPCLAIKTAPNPRDQEIVEHCDGIITIPSSSGNTTYPIPTKSRVFGLLLRRIEVQTSQLENNSKTQIRSRSDNSSDFEVSDIETSIARQIIRHTHEDEVPYHLTISPTSTVSDSDVSKEKCRVHNQPWVLLSSLGPCQASWWRCSFDPSQVGGGETASRCLIGLLRSGIALKIPSVINWPSEGNEIPPQADPQLATLLRPCPLCAAKLLCLDSSRFMMQDLFDDTARAMINPSNVCLCERGHFVAESNDAVSSSSPSAPVAPAAAVSTNPAPAAQAQRVEATASTDGGSEALNFMM